VSTKVEIVTDISELVYRCQQGDTEAFHLLFVRYSKPVLDFIYQMIGNRHTAEELMQESFVRAYRNLNSLRDSSKFSTWLFGIARNTVREVLKSQREENRRFGQKVALDEPVSLNLKDTGLKPDEQLLSSELNLLMQRALQTLSEDWRTVFILKLFHQQTYEEISEITGWSVGKIKMDLHRARQEMKRNLDGYINY